jgi:hypothetical protein
MAYTGQIGPLVRSQDVDQAHWLSRAVRSLRRCVLWKAPSGGSLAALALAVVLVLIAHNLLAPDLIGLHQEVDTLKEQAGRVSAAHAATLQAVQGQRERAEVLAAEFAALLERTEALSRHVTQATSVQTAAQQQRVRLEGLAAEITGLRQEFETVRREAALTRTQDAQTAQAMDAMVRAAADLVQEAQQQSELTKAVIRGSLGPETEALKSSRELGPETSDRQSSADAPVVPVSPSPASNKTDISEVALSGAMTEQGGASSGVGQPAPPISETGAPAPDTTTSSIQQIDAARHKAAPPPNPGRGSSDARSPGRITSVARREKPASTSPSAQARTRTTARVQSPGLPGPKPHPCAGTNKTFAPCGSVKRPKPAAPSVGRVPGTADRSAQATPSVASQTPVVRGLW